MDFMVNGEELEALYGLPHAQQLAYLRGIRPYMDVKTGTVGVKRRISLQSIAEQLYIEPHQGVKGEKYSRAQVRRALSALERAGLISLQSEEKQLILKCNLATLGYFTQNKVVTNQSQKAGTFCSKEPIENKGFYNDPSQKPVTVNPLKAVTPLIKDNYLYIFLQQKFEQFWSLYPEKKSKSQAWEIFQQLNPDDALFSKIMNALHKQIQHHQQKQLQGAWVPPWKYPANWLSKRAWEDEITMEQKQEIQHAPGRQNTRNDSGRDPFWNPEVECEAPRTNVIEFKER
ncbi:hypothetical protein [Legionella septentrionalis]|uniref:hypothetical protein n=1 Tax=Legionella septentrionalis TaxID=2498109 RepID=UPI000F8C5D3D|nr:hypothetical protein [Legionella septentrionalis]RUR14035.1 hypothetical protein ELY10_09465 [Legionella septentrionalis]